MRSRRNKRKSFRNKRKSFRNKRKSLRYRRKNMKGGFVIIKNLDGQITGINFSEATGELDKVVKLVEKNMATPNLLPSIIYDYLKQNGLDDELSDAKKFEIYQFIMSKVSKRPLH